MASYSDPRTPMTDRSSLTLVLAAGEGTRMRSTLPKVLHEVAGRSLLANVLLAAPAGKQDRLAVVVGPDHQAVADEARKLRPQAQVFVQNERKGTAHAVLAARAAMAERKVDLCNAGMMAFAGKTALQIFERIGNANSKGEYYLTDAVGIAREMGLRATEIETHEDEVRGINTKTQLAEAE